MEVNKSDRQIQHAWIQQRDELLDVSKQSHLQILPKSLDSKQVFLFLSGFGCF